MKKSHKQKSKAQETTLQTNQTSSSSKTTNTSNKYSYSTTESKPKENKSVKTEPLSLISFPRETLKLLGIFAIIAIAVTIVYSNHFNNAFHLDDTHTILENSYIKDINNLALFFKDGTTFSALPSNQSYRPMVTASLAFDYWLGKSLDPFYFHLSMFIVFLVQGLLMMFFYWKILEQAAMPPKLNIIFTGLATAWYLLHPVNAETINYVISRSDSYSTFFVILAFVVYMYSPLSRKLHLYLIPVALGALTKEPVVVFAGLLFFYQICFEQQVNLKALLEKFDKKEVEKVKNAIISSLPSILFCGALVVFLGVMRPKTYSPGGISLINYLITQPYVIAHYVASLFLPVWLSIDTDWAPFTTMAEIRIFIGFGAVAALVYLVIFTSQEQKLRPICFGIAWFLLALLPTSVVPLAEVLNYHRPFFPYVGIVLAALIALSLLLTKHNFISEQYELKPSITILLVLTVGCYAVGTHLRNKVWTTEEAIWKDATIKSPENGRALMSYGLTLMGKANYQEAEKYMVKALEYTPYYAYLHVNLGVLKESMAQPAEAEKYFQQAINYGSIYPTVFFFYGRFLKNQNRLPEAVEKLNKALELAPNHVDSQRMLMDIYQQQEDFTRLEALANQVLRQTPNNIDAKFYLEAARNKQSPLDTAKLQAYATNTPQSLLDLSLKYYLAGRYKECIDAANDALKLKPDYAEAYNNICTAYNGLKEWDKAIPACEQAIKLKPDFQLAKNNLAWAMDEKKKQP
ncbi:MAG: tetratricopeptide repeat protein [Acidobacteria bacterium]|nr:tetratricopeptide repeat protein [Acidobacteriota bacterium]